MKKVVPLVLFCWLSIFAQQQQDTPPIPQETPPEPVVPAQPLPEELIQTAPPQLPPTDSASIASAPAPEPAPKDTTPPPQAPSMPRHTITVDLGPTIIGVGVETAAKTFGKSKLKDVEISALGFAAQYEFQFFRWLSLPVKFAYMDFETSVTAKKTFVKHIDTTLVLEGVPDPNAPNFPGCLQTNNCSPKDTTINIDTKLPLEAKLEAELSIWSIEAHPRLYPFGGSFFLEGMLGYANLATDFKGKAIASVKMEIPKELADFDIPGLADTSYAVDVNFKASRGYLKYGGKLGWRVDFGKPGGFIFEHALGFYGASGFGKTIVDQLAENIEETIVNNPNPVVKVDKEKGVGVETEKFNDAFDLLEKFIFVGGPRYTFAFGWRF